jgi:glutaredoxin
MKIEMFHAPGCAACASARAELKAAARQAAKELEWLEVDVIDNLDRAVELGVLTLPAIVIDGKLAFTSLPTAAQLREAVLGRSKGRT